MSGTRSTWVAERVRRKAAAIWPDDDEHHRAIEALARYEGDKTEAGQTRVRLAMLKLSKGSLAKLEALVEDAERDFRDVVAAAEYPEELSSELASEPHLSPEEEAELERIRERDRRQYERWLDGS